MSYAKQVYDRAWEALAARKQAAREGALRRREEVRRRLPELAAIEREMATQSARVARLMITDPERAPGKIEALAEQNLRLQAKREALLAGAGYPPDYLAEHYTCAECQDSGYILNKRCGCMRALLRSEAAAQLGRSSTMRDCTFETFTLDYYDQTPDETGERPRDKMREKLRYCQSWAGEFSPASESLLMVGPAGVGKTHLSVAMAGRAASAGWGVVYTPIQRMMDALESEKFSRDSQTREKFQGATETYIDCDLLVLDDLGTEFANAFTGAALFNILNTRLVEAKPTIISTNLELADLKSRYNQRMASRLIYGYKVLRMSGKDIRYLKKKQRTIDN
ncbi:MAG: ATP-binding protein [Oscillospiraceae bacterium]|nr:ATP-binding protein [Oscillospiraceae bacterium]